MTKTPWLAAAAAALLSLPAASQAAPAAPSRPAASTIPQAVRVAADRHRAELCPASRASVLQRADLDGDGDADFFQDYAQVEGCTQLYPVTVVWWDRAGGYVEDEHAEAVLQRNASGYAFFQYRCDKADREAFQIEYFDAGGRPRRTACIPAARLAAVRARYGFTSVGD